MLRVLDCIVTILVGVNFVLYCFNLFCNMWACVCLGVLVIHVLVFTVFLYFFVYVYLFLFATSVRTTATE